MKKKKANPLIEKWSSYTPTGIGAQATQASCKEKICGHHISTRAGLSLRRGIGSRTNEYAIVLLPQGHANCKNFGVVTEFTAIDEKQAIASFKSTAESLRFRVR